MFNSKINLVRSITHPTTRLRPHRHPPPQPTCARNPFAPITRPLRASRRFSRAARAFPSRRAAPRPPALSWGLWWKRQ